MESYTYILDISMVIRPGGSLDSRGRKTSRPLETDVKRLGGCHKPTIRLTGGWSLDLWTLRWRENDETEYYRLDICVIR